MPTTTRPKPKTTPAYHAPRGIELIPKDKLTDLGNGEHTATVDARPELRRDDGSAAQVGDVLSCQPDGTLQTRPAGANGNFERCVIGASGLVYRPVGERAFLVPFTDAWPNG